MDKNLIKYIRQFFPEYNDLSDDMLGNRVQERHSSGEINLDTSDERVGDYFNRITQYNKNFSPQRGITPKKNPFVFDRHTPAPQFKGGGLKGRYFYGEEPNKELGATDMMINKLNQQQPKYASRWGELTEEEIRRKRDEAGTMEAYWFDANNIESATLPDTQENRDNEGGMVNL
jgi:hypothetical protein